jgi:hypothetical protein
VHQQSQPLGRESGGTAISDVRLPLSGGVTETINPWTWLFYGAGSQYGYININLGNAGGAVGRYRCL